MKIKLFIALFFLSCQNGWGQERIEIVATASMIADMVKNIAGDLANVETIVPIGGDPHTYDPTPSAAMLASRADLVFVNGLTFEGWLEELIRNSGTDAEIIRVTEGIQPIASEQYQNATDPHAWMSAKMGLHYILNIKNALVNYAPAEAFLIETNYKVYKRKLEALDNYIDEQIRKIPQEKRILITSHDAFQYYGRRYGIRLESMLGVSTDSDVQTSDIRRLNEVIRESNVPAIFIESTINPKQLEQIARDNGIKIGGKLYSDSLGDGDSPASTYIDMLRHNTDVIVEGLTMYTPQKTARDQKQNNGRPAWMNWAAIILIITLFGLIVLRRRNSNP